ncbi:MAG: hypothetical protein RDV48_16665 [Candidatus Eremiobacteraeota bacterium]|nr:hypothetical protein [Candidatus Eremiobacteraeota bacterium]
MNKKKYSLFSGFGAQLSLFFIVLYTISLLAGGCGSGVAGGGGDPSGNGSGLNSLWGGTAGTARLVIKLSFPHKGTRGFVAVRSEAPGGKSCSILREVPADTSYFTVSVCKQGTTESVVPSVRVDKPATGVEATATVENVPIGWKTVRVEADNASGQAIAWGSSDVDVVTGENPEMNMALSTVSPTPSPSVSPTPSPSVSPSPSPSVSPSPATTPWQTLAGTGGNPLNAVTFSGASTGWAVGGNGQISVTTDGGNNWSGFSKGSDHLYGISMVDNTTGWAVGGSSGAMIYKTTNGGATASDWTAQESPATKPLYGVSFSDSNIGTVVGDRGGDSPAYSTTDGGTTWIVTSNQFDYAPGDLRAVDMASADEGVVVGLKGGIFNKHNGRWAYAFSPPTKENLYAVCYFDSAHIWAVGDNGTVVFSSDEGNNWALNPSVGTESLRGVYFADANNGWVVGLGGRIYSTGDGGSTWTSQTSGTSDDLRGIFMTSSLNGFAAGGNSSSLLLRTFTGGK